MSACDFRVLAGNRRGIQNSMSNLSEAKEVEEGGKMSDKHDAMWGVDAGAYIAQQEAEIARLTAEVTKKDYLIRNGEIEATNLHATNTRLTALLEEIRHHVKLNERDLALRKISAALADEQEGK
jgi:hypothetical protein